MEFVPKKVSNSPLLMGLRFSTEQITKLILLRNEGLRYFNVNDVIPHGKEETAKSI